jgi:Leucine-rich repeat (LRR) protein
MPRFNIERYLHSLPKDTIQIDVSCKDITDLPDLTGFTNLQYLYCDDNYLISLPRLPKSLLYLSCHRNKIRALGVLPMNLQYLYCSYNSLKSLPEILPVNLRELYCMCNQLASLPALPESLLHLYCAGNKITHLSALPESLLHLQCHHNLLTSMPKLPESITSFNYCFNPIWEKQSQIIRDHNVDVLIIIKRINTLNSFCYLYYSLKFKSQFRRWLWEKVRKPKIEKKYHPNYLIANLKEDIDLNRFLEYWINII